MINLCRAIDTFILIIIAINSIALAAYDYRDRGSLTTRNKVIEKMLFAFTVIFIIEAALKIIAYGFVMTQNTYLRLGWNVIDFIVVIVGYHSLYIVNHDIEY
jgi:hypothetical protein